MRFLPLSLSKPARRLVPGDKHGLGLLGVGLVALPTALHHHEGVAWQTILRGEVSRLR